MGPSVWRLTRRLGPRRVARPTSHLAVASHHLMLVLYGRLTFQPACVFRGLNKGLKIVCVLGTTVHHRGAVKKTGLKASDRFLRLHTAPAVFLNPQAGAVG